MRRWLLLENVLRLELCAQDRREYEARWGQVARYRGPAYERNSAALPWRVRAARANITCLGGVSESGGGPQRRTAKATRGFGTSAGGGWRPSELWKVSRYWCGEDERRARRVDAAAIRALSCPQLPERGGPRSYVGQGRSGAGMSMVHSARWISVPLSSLSHRPHPTRLPPDCCPLPSDRRLLVPAAR